MQRIDEQSLHQVLGGTGTQPQPWVLPAPPPIIIGYRPPPLPW